MSCDILTLKWLIDLNQLEHIEHVVLYIRILNICTTDFYQFVNFILKFPYSHSHEMLFQSNEREREKKSRQKYKINTRFWFVNSILSESFDGHILSVLSLT